MKRADNPKTGEDAQNSGTRPTMKANIVAATVVSGRGENRAGKGEPTKQQPKNKQEKSLGYHNKK